MNNLLQAVEQSVVNKTTNSRMKELEQQIEDLDRQILVEKSKVNSKVSEEEIRVFYKEALLKEPMLLINTLIKEIKLYNDKVEITFNSPIMRSPDNHGFSFLTKNMKMKKVIQNKPDFVYKDIIVNYYI